jgi:hypothetical protein
VTSISEVVIKLDKMMILTFRKLLDISMLANKSSGIVNKLRTIFDLLVFFSTSTFVSVGVNEKNATSDPEIIAEQNKSTITTRISIIIGKVIG